MKKQRIVIIGFGDTGVLSAIHLPKQYEITAISTKPLLVSGQELGLRLTRQQEWREYYYTHYSQYPKLEGVNIIHGKVSHVDANNNALKLVGFDNQTQHIEYDALLIASGVENGFWRQSTLLNEQAISNEMNKQQRQISKANEIAIIGGGPSGVSAAYNIKKQQPNKQVSLYFSRDKVLPQYPEKARDTVSAYLQEVGVKLISNKRANMADAPSHICHNAQITWQDGEQTQHQNVLWAIGTAKPNSDFISKHYLDEQGFVKVDAHLQVIASDNIFAVGDIAATDPNRSSARNEGFKIVASNIHRYLQSRLNGKTAKYKSYKAPQYRWGSIIGIQDDEGLRVFTPTGGNVRVAYSWVKRVLFPLFVHKMIYKGFNSQA